MEKEKTFETKKQLLHRLQEGVSFGDGKQYTAAEYQRVASEKTKQWKATYYPDHDLLSRHSHVLEHNDKQENNSDRKMFTPENLERDYWDIVETHSKEVAVEYGVSLSPDKKKLLQSKYLIARFSILFCTTLE